MNKILKKKAVVTGGAGGIGSEIVKMMLKQGYDVWIVDKVQPKIKSVLFAKTDLSKMEEIQSTTEQIINKWKTLDVIINCAGIYPSIHFDEYSVELWWECLSVNVTAPFVIAKKLVPLMKSVPRGYIVNITSGAVYLGSRDPGYCASKAALSGLTKSMAQNLASRNIVVNAIAPGPIDTPMSRKGMRQDDVKEYLKRIPLHRFGEAQEIANTVCYLISGKADYMVGSTIHVNGGLFLN